MSLEFLELELCKQYHIHPLEWDSLPRKLRMTLLAKRELEIEREKRLQQEIEKMTSKPGRG